MTQRITVDGREYASWADVPDDSRERIEALAVVPALLRGVVGNAIRVIADGAPAARAVRPPAASPAPPSMPPPAPTPTPTPTPTPGAPGPNEIVLNGEIVPVDGAPRRKGLLSRLFGR